MTRISPSPRFEFGLDTAAPSRCCALCVGSPDTVAGKIANTVRALGLSRLDLKYSSGTLSHELMKTSIELIGTQVAPRVRRISNGLTA